MPVVPAFTIRAEVPAMSMARDIDHTSRRIHDSRRRRADHRRGTVTRWSHNNRSGAWTRNHHWIPWSRMPNDDMRQRGKRDANANTDIGA